MSTVQPMAEVVSPPKTTSLAESQRYTHGVLSEAIDRVEGLLARLRGAVPTAGSGDKPEAPLNLLEEFHVVEAQAAKLTTLLTELQTLIDS